MNEHIAHYQIWSATYLMWANSNIDRIVRETVKKYKEEMKEEKEKAKRDAFNNSTYGRIIAGMNAGMKNWRNKYAEEIMKDCAFMSGTLWDAKDIKIGSTLKIKLPEEPSPPPRVPSLLSSIRERFPKWLNSNLLQIGQTAPPMRPK